MLDRINFMLSIAEEHNSWSMGMWNPEIIYGGKRKIYYIRRSWVI